MYKRDNRTIKKYTGNFFIFCVTMMFCLLRSIIYTLLKQSHEALTSVCYLDELVTLHYRALQYPTQHYITVHYLSFITIPPFPLLSPKFTKSLNSSIQIIQSICFARSFLIWSFNNKKLTDHMVEARTFANFVTNFIQDSTKNQIGYFWLIQY